MDIVKKLNDILTDYKGEEVALEASTTLDDLGFDSLDKVELLMKIEDEFNITLDDDFVIETVTELVEKIQALIK